MRARRRDREHVSGDGDAARTTTSGGQPPGGSGGNKGGGKGRKNRGKHRNRNRGGGGGGGGSGGAPRATRTPKNHEVGFWGEVDRLPEPSADVRITDDPAAVARSLGAPPLPGHEAIAAHYFTVVYERAVQTAGALAAVGGLIDPETLAAELSD